MNFFTYIATVLFLLVLAMFVGTPVGLEYPKNIITAGPYYVLLAGAVALLLLGLFCTISGLRKHKKNMRRNGEVLLISGLILWAFVGLRTWGIGGF
ncbi:MAG: hypothetical protein LBE06_06060 [Azoarcus sp.]|jgi:uncharacterized integral membrane protein|nr:hypothetical protein [Azoarcus sp.]